MNTKTKVTIKLKGYFAEFSGILKRVSRRAVAEDFIERYNQSKREAEKLI